MLKEIRGDLELHFSDREGYYFVSNKTGLIYELLEGMSYKGKASSDIIIIMIANQKEGYIGMLNYIFGAGFLKDSLNACFEIIEDFENNKTKMLGLQNF